MKKTFLFFVALLAATVSQMKAQDSLMYITARNAGTELSLDKQGSGLITVKLQYSMDRASWTDYTWSETKGAVLTFTNAGDSIFFRAKNKNASMAKKSVYLHFVASDTISAGGKLVALLDKSCATDSASAYAFTGLFRDCQQLVDASELIFPSKLSAYSYYAMFYECSSLTKAPELTNISALADCCFGFMFFGCSSLAVDAMGGSCDGAEMIFPEEGAEDWNKSMFSGCYVFDEVQLGGHYCVSEWAGLREMVYTKEDVEALYTGAAQKTTLVVELPKQANFAISADGVNWQDTVVENNSLVRSCTNVCSDTVYVKVNKMYYKETMVALCLKINPRQVQLTSSSDAKLYDGTPLTNGDVTLTGDGWADGEGMDYQAVGTQTNAGESINTIVYTWNEGTDSTNYVFAIAEGTLTVDKRQVTMTSASSTKMYDGEELVNESVELSGDGFADGEGYTYTVMGSITNAGQVDNTFEYVLNEGTNPDNYTITTQYGTLKVTMRTVIMSSASLSKPFDGKALTGNAVTETGDGFLEGEGATYTFTGKQTQVGTSDNVFAYTLNENTLATNYKIYREFGELTVANSIFPEIVGMYDKWNIVLNNNALVEAFRKVGIEVTIQPNHVTWYTVVETLDVVDSIQGKISGDDKLAIPSSGLFHTEAKTMDGQYYAVVYVPEALSAMGIAVFQSNVVFMNSKKMMKPVDENGGESTNVVNKMIINGKLVIKKDGEYFNALGGKM